MPFVVLSHLSAIVRTHKEDYERSNKQTHTHDHVREGVKNCCLHPDTLMLLTLLMMVMVMMIMTVALVGMPLVSVQVLLRLPQAYFIPL